MAEANGMVAATLTGKIQIESVRRVVDLEVKIWILQPYLDWAAWRLTVISTWRPLFARSFTSMSILKRSILPRYADQRDHLTLKSSWAKGGKARTILIRTASQRDVLDRAHKLAGKGALIPSSRDYRQQQRYEELTGWKSPAASGPSTKSLTDDQRDLDRKARLVINRELGHERRQVVSVYLGI